MLACCCCCVNGAGVVIDVAAAAAEDQNMGMDAAVGVVVAAAAATASPAVVGTEVTAQPTALLLLPHLSLMLLSLNCRHTGSTRISFSYRERHIEKSYRHMNVSAAPASRHT